MDEDAHTLKIVTELFVRPDIEDEVVYDFVKQALDNAADYRDSHVVCREITAESAAKSIIPLHPGAEKYYREVGAIK